MEAIRRPAAVIALGVVALAGAWAAPASAKPKQQQTDKQAATAALLQLSELPAGDPSKGFRGWEGPSEQCSRAGQAVPCPVPPIPAPADDVLLSGNPDPAFPACAATTKAETASSKYRADSPDFFSNADTIGNSIYVFPKVKQAKAYIAAYAQPAARQCFEHGVEGHTSSSERRQFPDFDASSVPTGSLNEGVGFSSWVPAFGTNPDGDTFQDVRFRSGRAAIFLSTNFADVLGGPAPVYFPGTANYLVTIADRLRQQLKK